MEGKDLRIAALEAQVLVSGQMSQKFQNFSEIKNRWSLSAGRTRRPRRHRHILRRSPSALACGDTQMLDHNFRPTKPWQIQRFISTESINNLRFFSLLTEQKFHSWTYHKKIKPFALGLSWKLNTMNTMNRAVCNYLAKKQFSCHFKYTEALLRGIVYDQTDLILEGVFARCYISRFLGCE